MRNIMRTSSPSRPLLIVVAAGSDRSARSTNPSRRARTEIPTVPVAKASTEDLSHGLVLTAEFKPYQEVDVMAKVAGYVKKINVDVGDRVKQGQLLATLEIPEMADDLTRADAAVDRAKAEVARAKDELQRAESAHRSRISRSSGWPPSRRRSPGWSRSRRSTMRRARTWSPKRRSPPRNPRWPRPRSR